MRAERTTPCSVGRCGCCVRLKRRASCDGPTFWLPTLTGRSQRLTVGPIRYPVYGKDALYKITAKHSFLSSRVAMHLNQTFLYCYPLVR